MKKAAFLLFFLSSALLHAQDARKIFTEMPDTILSLLTPVNRADMIDFLESNMKAEVNNRLNGPSEMKVSRENYIAVDLTSQSSWQMKLLPTSDSTFVISTIHTVCGTACDSEIYFYSSGWEPLNRERFLSLPPEVVFFPAPADSISTDEYERTRSIADIYTRKADFTPDDPTLTFTYTSTDYVSGKDREKLEAITRKTISYRWNGKDQFIKED